MRILAIETSCDETAAAVVDDGRRVLSNVIASQVKAHAPYGGVVPELASRHHLQNMRPVLDRCLADADVATDTVDAIAVTAGPGLVGSLLIGVSFAKALAFRLGRPLIAVNHLEGHVRSVFMEHDGIELPAMALVVSGGHTSLYLLPEPGRYVAVAKTRDDAAGEAYDKVAKMLGLGYPGGPVIDRMARRAVGRTRPFPIAQMRDGSADFSFSGLKTAVLRHATGAGIEPVDGDEGAAPEEVVELVWAFQESAVRQLVERTLLWARRERVRSVLLCGGVACNTRLRAALTEAGERDGFAVYYPSPGLTTDNAAMIAAAAQLRHERGERAGLELNADPNLAL